MPGHAAFDLRQMDVHARQGDHAHAAAIAVLLGPRHFDRFAQDQFRLGLLGLLTIGLRSLRGAKGAPLLPRSNHPQGSVAQHQCAIF
jgi:hypothetical protein